MKRRFGRLDAGSLVVAVITLALFLAALAIKGLGHEILLEAGVFLVSVKLLMMVHKEDLTAEQIKDRLDQSEAILRRIEEKLGPDGRQPGDA